MDIEYKHGGVDDTFEYGVVPSQKEEEGYILRHGQTIRGEIRLNAYNKAILQWYSLGPIPLDQAKAWLRGIVDLILMGEELESEAKKKVKHSKPKSKGRMVRSK